MESMIRREGEVDRFYTTLPAQAAVVLLHTVVALLSWVGLMALGYAMNRPQISQGLVLTFSFCVPLLVGAIFNYFRQDQLAATVWLIGLIWFLVIALRVMDMPTGPNACYQCDATDKLTRTFFSYPTACGLLDNDGPLFATWPAAALLGYSMGALFTYRKQRSEADED